MRSSKAFTLIEILIVIAIVAILGTVSVVFLWNRRNTVYLTDTTAQVAALLREAQSRSMVQDQGLVWGVHFDNGSSSPTPFYAMFSGASYATGTVANHFPLPVGVCFATSSVAQGSSTDVVSQDITGAISTSTSIVFNLVSGGCAGSVTTSTLLAINSLGAVTIQDNSTSSSGGGGGGGGSPPGQPGTPSYASISTSTLAVSWTLASGSPTYYTLQRSTDGVTFSQLATTTSLSYNDAALSPNSTYYYEVSATNSYGTGSYSTNSSVKTNPFACTGTLGSWATSTPLAGDSADGLQFPSAVVNNGYMYTIGGSADGGGTGTSTVLYAAINNDGTIGSWLTTSPLPNGLYEHSAVVSNGYVYTVGGEIDSNTLTSTVLYAPINSNGTIGSWLSTTPLPSALYLHSAVVNNGYIYAVGGATDESNDMTSTVFYAPINGNGTIGSWLTTTPLPVTLYEHSAVVNNGYIYALDGINFPNPTTTVFYAPINSNGTIGSWSTTTPLPSSYPWEPRGIANNGYIYSTEGVENCHGFHPRICTPVPMDFYVSINNDGTVGSWITGTYPSTTNQIYFDSSVANNGYLYMVGGNGSADVWYAACH